MHLRPLIASPSPRDIPEFIRAINELPDDILLVKYYEEPQAYKIIQTAFLELKEYTHLVILPDDVIVTKEQYMKLRRQVETNDYLSLAGTMAQNIVDIEISVTMPKLPHLINEVWEPYHYFTFKELDRFKENPTQKVGFDGFACTFLRRDVVEKLSFKPFVLYKNTSSQGFDYTVGLELEQNNIPMYVDTSVRIQHLGVPVGGIMMYWGVGVREPNVLLLEKDVSPNVVL